MHKMYKEKHQSAATGRSICGKAASLRRMKSSISVFGSTYLQVEKVYDHENASSYGSPGLPIINTGIEKLVSS